MLGEFGIDARGDLYRVGPDSPLVGQRLRDLKLAQRHQLWVIGVERQERFGSTIEAAPGPDTVIRAGDVLIVHDPQPAAMGAMLAKELDIHTVWRCHIGLDADVAQTRAAWELLEPHISSYDHTVFTAAEYIPAYLTGTVSTIAPAIDPLWSRTTTTSFATTCSPLERGLGLTIIR